MARGFRRRGTGQDLRYAARLDEVERALVVSLMEQVRDLLASAEPAGAAPGTGDADFDEIVAGLGDLGRGIELDAASGAWPDTGPVPETARSFGERDPALERLLPSGNRADPEAAAEYRRLTESGLRRRKLDGLESAIAALRRSGERVTLDEPTAVAVMVALTDVRLVIGERLGLREDDDVERLEVAVTEAGENHPMAQAVEVYEFLTWLQETLAHALMGTW